jgi:hypothetical protein
MLKAVARGVCPPLIWDAAHRLRRGPPPAPSPPPPNPPGTWQGVKTPHNMSVLSFGRFADIYDRHAHLDPTFEKARLRVYHQCFFARYALQAAGDFVIAGISYGGEARVIYDYTDLAARGRTLHLVDPFEGANNAAERTVLAKYNTDADYVRRQYPAGAPVTFHRGFIPQVLPLPGADHFAFVYMNTGDWVSEAASIAHFYDRLSPGGVMVINNYAIEPGYQHIYDPALDAAGAHVLTLVTGQGVIPKAR